MLIDFHQSRAEELNDQNIDEEYSKQGNDKDLQSKMNCEVGSPVTQAETVINCTPLENPIDEEQINSLKMMLSYMMSIQINDPTNDKHPSDGPRDGVNGLW